jgi:transposase-like protein
MTPTISKTKPERVVHSAREKAQAVLAGWTERRRPSEICRELQITPTVLSHWQERAMEGMLAALEPRTRPPEEQKPPLPAKVERLLARKSSRDPLTRFSRRLATLQQAKGSDKAPPAAETSR